MYSHSKSIDLLTFVFIYIIAAGLISNYEARRFPPIRYPKFSSPHIWLAEYSFRNDKLRSVLTSSTRNSSTFEDDFVTKNQSDYVITEDVTLILLACQASYPIEMKFPFPKQLRYPSIHSGMVSKRLSEFNEDLDEPLTQSYVVYTQISFRNTNFFSSTLACQSVDNSAVNSSVHVYKLSFDRIDRRGETIQVNVDPSHNTLQVDLPCRPASPTASILLQKQTQTTVWKDNKFTSVAIWKDVKWTSFDPRTGITLTLPNPQVYYDTIPPSIFGLYKCILSKDSDSDENEYVFVNVTSGISGSENENTFHSKFILRGKASAGQAFYNDKDYVNRIQLGDFSRFRCCSGVPSKPPSQIVIPCRSVLECDVYKLMLPQIWERVNKLPTSLFLHSHFNDSSDCATNILLGGAAIVLCRGENVDIVDEYYKLFAIQGKPEELTKRKNPLSVESSTNENDYQPLSVAWSTQARRRILLSIGKPGYVKVRNPVKAPQHVEQFAKRRYSSKKDLWSISKKVLEEMKISEVDDPMMDIYEDELIHYMCFGLSMFHANGGYIRLNWMNGSKTVLEEAAYRTVLIYYTGSQYELGSYGMNPLIGQVIPANREMVSVECFQPVWNASGWEKIELKLQVHASQEPVFSGSTEEIVYFNLHETGHEIRCELSQGTPPPGMIVVTKDEKQIKIIQNAIPEQVANGTKSSIKVSSDKDNIVTIKFESISYESHGVYQCTAENIKGKAVRTVRVFVIEKSSGFFSVFLVCIALMAVILLGLGTWMWIQRRKLQFFQNRQF